MKYIEKLKEALPDAKCYTKCQDLVTRQCPPFCVAHAFGGKHLHCTIVEDCYSPSDGCVECWNREMEEHDGIAVDTVCGLCKNMKNFRGIK